MTVSYDSTPKRLEVCLAFGIIPFSSMKHHHDDISNPMNLKTEACTEILAALSQPGNVERLARARELAGTDMVKVMREVFPIVTQIQLEVYIYILFPFLFACLNFFMEPLF